MVLEQCCSYQSFDEPNLLPQYCGNVGQIAIFMSLVNTIIKYNAAGTCNRGQNADPYPSITDVKEYDFIVVGGGVAGAVIASRLSENPRHDVLLLEAGMEEPVATSVPTFFYSAIGSLADWNYTTTRQKNACLANGGICKIPRGKMMGGTGSMSGNMYTRGHKEMYDQWEKDGNTGWGYNRVLSYFKKSESNVEPSEEIEKELHGFVGPMTIQRSSYKPGLVDDLLEAVRQTGFDIGDLNGFNQSRFGLAPLMVKDGRRASTPRMYIRLMPPRSNLRVQINSFVTRINFDSKHRATGVEYTDHRGKSRKAKTAKEIVLSAGAFGSPLLLLRSGVGPEEDLSKLNIKLVKNLPVGRNLQHHVSVAVNYNINATFQNALSLAALDEWVRTRSGPFASVGLTQITGFLNSNVSKSAIPDVQIFFDGLNSNCTRYEEGCSKTVRNKTVRIALRPVNLIPKSVGYVKLRSDNPFDKPIINPNYFADDQDIKVLLEGVNVSMRIMKAAVLLDKYNVELDKNQGEECSHVKSVTSAEFWECVIRRYTQPENHPHGTCKMGPATDNTTVVGSDLRVHGIKNLRVIDASIFPTAINCNPIGPIVMSAEKGAAIIKSDWIFQ